MKLEPEDIQSFQKLWQEQFQEEISAEDARRSANCLLEMMQVVYRPLPKPEEKKEAQQLSILDLNTN